MHIHDTSIQTHAADSEMQLLRVKKASMMCTLLSVWRNMPDIIWKNPCNWQQSQKRFIASRSSSCSPEMLRLRMQRDVLFAQHPERDLPNANQCNRETSFVCNKSVQICNGAQVTTRTQLLSMRSRESNSENNTCSHQSLQNNQFLFATRRILKPMQGWQKVSFHQ